MRFCPHKSKKPPRFPWAASQELCFSSRLAAPPGLVLEDAGNRHVRPRAFGVIDAEVPTLTAAKQTSARRRYARPRRFARWLAQDRHDQITLSAPLVAVKKNFGEFRNCASGLRESVKIAQREIGAGDQRPRSAAISRHQPATSARRYQPSCLRRWYEGSARHTSRSSWRAWPAPASSFRALRIRARL